MPVSVLRDSNNKLWKGEDGPRSKRMHMQIGVLLMLCCALLYTVGPYQHGGCESCKAVLWFTFNVWTLAV